VGKPDPEDLALIARANRGDVAAFEELYQRHRDWVVGLAHRLTNSRDDALDVLQEVFTYFFKKFPVFELSTNLRGFLFPVVRNTALSVIRKRRKVVEIDEARQPSTLDWGETRGDLERLVAGLPEAQRQVVLLRFGAQMRLEEIAEALAIPPGTVKSRLHNALKTLRNNLEGEDAAG
jgi:RNA polymerase sigma-70 factor (ECF subfamily)